MLTEIFYFTGTGNSLKIAQMLSKKIKDSKLSPIIGALKNKTIRIEAKITGLIFPIHAFSIPFPVEKFLKTFDFTNADYIFAIATRFGSPCHVFKDIDKLLKRQNKKINSAFYMNMPNNYLILWDGPDKDEINKLSAQAEKKMNDIAGIILRKENNMNYSHGDFYLEHLLFPILSKLNKVTRYFWLETSFYTEENCNGCGICENVCTSEKIKISNGKPIWNKKIKCNFCFACIQYCPQKAIQFNMTKSKSRKRYHHPDVGFKEIANQKE